MSGFIGKPDVFANGECIKKGADQLFVIFVSRIVQVLRLTLMKK